MNIIEILSKYKYITTEIPLGIEYIFSNHKGHYLSIILYDKGEIRFLYDNFPNQRRIFNTNIPYRSVEDFERDLERMKIPIPEKLHKIDVIKEYNHHNPQHIPEGGC